ncbi:MAG: hypothetical protein AVDCRST_MAG13-3777, partial [uncultured Solirubrobacteraceae bacterium]
DPQVHRHQHGRRVLRRLRAHAAAGRERGHLPGGRLAADRLRAVHLPRRARGLDPRGPGRRLVQPGPRAQA